MQNVRESRKDAYFYGVFPVGLLLEEEVGGLQVAVDGRGEGLLGLQAADDEGRRVRLVRLQHLQHLCPAGVARPLLLQPGGRRGAGQKEEES